MIYQHDGVWYVTAVSELKVGTIYCLGFFKTCGTYLGYDQGNYIFDEFVVPKIDMEENIGKIFQGLNLHKSILNI